MSIAYLNESKTAIARLCSAERGVHTVNGNFGSPFILYSFRAEEIEQCIALTPKETLRLLAFLKENDVQMKRMAEEEEEARDASVQENR